MGSDCGVLGNIQHLVLPAAFLEITHFLGPSSPCSRSQSDTARSSSPSAGVSSSRDRSEKDYCGASNDLGTDVEVDQFLLDFHHHPVGGGEILAQLLQHLLKLLAADIFFWKTVDDLEQLSVMSVLQLTCSPQ